MARSLEITSDLDLDERVRLLDAWVEKRRLIARLESEAADLLGERIAIHDSDVASSPFHRDAIYRSMVAEYSAAGMLPRATIEGAFLDARIVHSDLPMTRAAFAAGMLSAGHVREIVRGREVVSEAIRNKKADAVAMELYETAVVPFALRETAARTRPHARAVAAAVVGATVTERHERATDERAVTIRSLDDGLALITAVLPEWLAVAIHDRLTTMARHISRTRAAREPVLDPHWFVEPEGSAHPDDLSPADPAYADAHGHGIITRDDTLPGASISLTRIATTTVPSTPGSPLIDPLDDPINGTGVAHIAADERTLDQLRADLFTDLLLATDPSETHGSGLDSIHGRIQVTIAAATVAGADNGTADLDGHGPLHPDIARAIAGRNSGWTRLFLDPTGMLKETDTYTPTEAMRRHLRARDQHCRFPGCRMPVHRSEIDHNHDHAKGGATHIDNLAHLCTTHHSLKHPDVDSAHRWTATQLEGGVVNWQSPLGRTYTDRPAARVMFV